MTDFVVEISVYSWNVDGQELDIYEESFVWWVLGWFVGFY